MKNKIISITFALATLFFYSCSPEEDITTESQLETNVAELVLIPKVLATIKLSNDIGLIFRSEEDAVILEIEGSTNAFNGLGELRGLTTLETFLALTNNDIAVPQDLITIEDNPKIKSMAIQRGTIEKHSTTIKSLKVITNQKSSINYCSSNSVEDSDQFGQYTRVFNYWVAPVRELHSEPRNQGTNFYSSGKTGGNKCKELELVIVNCKNDDTYGSIKIKTYYKNAFKKYIRRKQFTVSRGKWKRIRMTFIAKKYRRTTISTTTPTPGITVNRFGGYLRYSRY